MATYYQVSEVKSAMMANRLYAILGPVLISLHLYEYG